jgi:hypothetical protein
MSIHAPTTLLLPPFVTTTIGSLVRPLRVGRATSITCTSSGLSRITRSLSGFGIFGISGRLAFFLDLSVFRPFFLVCTNAAIAAIAMMASSQ